MLGNQSLKCTLQHFDNTHRYLCIIIKMTIIEKNFISKLYKFSYFHLITSISLASLKSTATSF